MGIDFLDLNFRIEKQFRFRLETSDWEPFMRRRYPPDIAAREVALLIASKLARLRRRNEMPKSKCVSCKSSLQGLPLEWECPSCKTAYRYEGYDVPVWEPLRHVIADALGLKPEDVREHALLRKDLGME